ncbi:unnamed protein product, partial [Mesorhabditis spiculigera]
MNSSLLLTIFIAFLYSIAAANTPEPEAADPEKLSDCVKKCLGPIYKMKRTFLYVFENFEKVCELLEDGAFCAQKCEKEDQHKFWQFTTFYRVYCVNHEEELEEHLPCLKAAAKDVDSVCHDRCRTVNKAEPGMNKQEKLDRACKAVECSTVCYFHEFAQDCPKAQSLLIRMNLDQINEVSLSLHPKQHEGMSHECRDIHNLEYMKAAMLASLEE